MCFTIPHRSKYIELVQIRSTDSNDFFYQKIETKLTQSNTLENLVHTFYQTHRRQMEKIEAQLTQSNTQNRDLISWKKREKKNKEE